MWKLRRKRFVDCYRYQDLNLELVDSLTRCRVTAFRLGAFSMSLSLCLNSPDFYFYSPLKKVATVRDVSKVSQPSRDKSRHKVSSLGYHASDQ